MALVEDGVWQIVLTTSFNHFVLMHLPAATCSLIFINRLNLLVLLNLNLI